MTTTQVSELKGNRIYCFSRAQSTRVVVFFGGDQVEPEYLPTKLQPLQDPAFQAAILQEKFPDSSVFVVKPSRMDGPYSCFDNFLNKTTRSGEPLGYDGRTFKASLHLHMILTEGLKLPILEQGGSLIIVGFSKGGVVLTQLLYELSLAEELSTPSALILQSIKQLYYLDAGLSCRGIHLTDPRIAQMILALQKHMFTVHLLGTPRNWDDARKPWIASEKSRCAELLKDRCFLTKLYEGETPSLEMHFNILLDFVPVKFS